jgi:hypothetical protein
MRPVGLRYMTIVLLLIAACIPAALRCDLALQNHPTRSVCIDPARLKGDTVRVPGNTTRIGRDGLALCAQRSAHDMAPDIAYIIDNSTSMSAKAFRQGLDTNRNVTTDTSWYMAECLDKLQGTGGWKVAGWMGDWRTLRKRHFGGTGIDSLGWDSLLEVPTTSPDPAKSYTGSCSPANDPYSMRAEVVKRAIAYQASLDSTSQAGLIQFNLKVNQSSALRPLQGDGLLHLMDSAGLYPAGVGTYWEPPLDSAYRQLIVSVNSQKVIIMVSDGEPNNQADIVKYRKLVHTAGFPKVYGIFLGDNVTDVPEMDTLAAATGGRYWIVPPDRPDSMERVIRSIVANVVEVSIPTSAALANVTNNQSSSVLSLLKRKDTSFAMRLDSVVALDTGANRMRLVSGWKDPKGGSWLDTTDFVLSVSGQNRTSKDTLDVDGDSIFATRCADASRLSLLDTNLAAVPFLKESMGMFAIRLQPSMSERQETEAIGVATRIGGDRETLALAASHDSTLYTGRSLLQVPRPWQDQTDVLDASDIRDSVVATWCHARDGRDCAEAALGFVSYARPWIAWDSSFVPGTSGRLGAKAYLPGETKDTVFAEVLLKGQILSTLRMVRTTDSVHVGEFLFRQGIASAGKDTVWIANPGPVDSLMLSYRLSRWQDTLLMDTAWIFRPQARLSLRHGNQDTVAIGLSGGAQADAKGRWNVRIAVGARFADLTMDSLSGTADVVSLLAATVGTTATVQGFFVDPLYGDTLRDSVTVPVPLQSLHFVKDTVIGPVGSLDLVAKVPWSVADSLRLLLLHGSDTSAVWLLRTVAGSYQGKVCLAQVRASGKDTIFLGGPKKPGSPDSVAAVLPSDGIHPELLDRAWILRPAHTLRMEVDSLQPQTIHVQAMGVVPDSLGNAKVLILSPAKSAVEMVAQGSLSWKGGAVLDLPESMDSTTVTGCVVDPLYHDTTWATLRMGPVWYPGSIVATPDSLDPRKPDTVTITVRDRDRDSLHVDSVVVMTGNRPLWLVETARNSGTYSGKLAAAQLDPDWLHRAPRKTWKLVLEYRDPDHPVEVSRDTVKLAYDVPPAEVMAQQTVADRPTSVTSGGSLRLQQVASGQELSNMGQGISVCLWEPVRLSAFVYDLMGTAVDQWHGEVIPENGETGGRYLLHWDGHDASGRPAVVGVYLVRVVTHRADGTFLANEVFRIGLR